MRSSRDIDVSVDVEKSHLKVCLQVLKNTTLSSDKTVVVGRQWMSAAAIKSTSSAGKKCFILLNFTSVCRELFSRLNVRVHVQYQNNKKMKKKKRNL